MLTYANSYITRSITADDGLPQSDVKCITPDREGNIWITTNDGVVRYDGETFTSITAPHNETPTTQSRVVRCDGEGNIWIGTMDNGLFIYDTSAGVLRHMPQSPSYVYDIALDTKLNRAWIAGHRGEIYRVDGTAQSDKWRDTAYYIGEREDTSNISQLMVNESGSLIAIRNRAAYRYNAAEDRFEEYLPELLQGVTQIAQYDGRLYYIKGGRLHTYDTIAERSQSSDIVNITRIFISSSGELWLFGTDGVLLKDLTTEDITTPARVIHRELLQVLTIVEDDRGDIWVGVLRQGIRVISADDRAFKLYNKGMNVESLYENQDGAIFIGSVTGDLHIMTPEQDGGYETRRVGLNLSKLSIFFISENNYNNEYIIGRAGATATLNRDNMRHDIFAAHAAKESTANSARSVVADSTYLWFASYTSGLSLYDAASHKLISRFTSESPELKLPSSRVRNVMIDSKDNIWVATSDGLVRIEAQSRFDSAPSYRVYQHDPANKSSLSYNYVIPMAEGLDGRIWVGTFGGGLNALKVNDQGDIIENTIYTTNNALSNNSIKAIVVDDENVVWATTNRGLNRIDPVSGEVDIYTPEDGLQSYEFSELSAVKLHDGRIAFGGVDGVNIFDPKSVDYGANRVARGGGEVLTQSESGWNKWSGWRYTMLAIGAAIIIAAIYTLRRRRSQKSSTLMNSDLQGEGLDVGSEALSEADQRFIDEATRVIEENIADPTLSVESLCERLKMSKATLNKRLKRLTDKTANSFIRSVKMQRAAKILESGECTIAETTYAIGLNDLRHFRESFKREFGVLPSEYINTLRRDKSGKHPL